MLDNKHSPRKWNQVEIQDLRNDQKRQKLFDLSSYLNIYRFPEKKFKMIIRANNSY